MSCPFEDLYEKNKSYEYQLHIVRIAQKETQKLK